MTKLKDKPDTIDKNIVKIAMKCGRLPIKSAYHKWINAADKVKIPGVVLHMKNIENGGDGYAELDLNDPEDAATYKVFLQWYEEGRDPRIKANGVMLVEADRIARPMPWWDDTKAEDLVKQVADGIDKMRDAGEREAWVRRCVTYEQQRETPRKTLISKLLDLELDGVNANDPMAVPD
jgi:hypothetical protein